MDKEKRGKDASRIFLLCLYREAVRSGDWKYDKKEIFRIKEIARDTKGFTLYNLAIGIGESQNVIDQDQETAPCLAESHDEYLQRIFEQNRQ